MTSLVPKPVSKREFLNGLACSTMAYFDGQGPSASIQAGLRWKFYEGNQVGALAREVIGPGRELPLFGEEALSASREALAARSERLYEVTMSAGGLLARADAMCPVTDGWELIEVKSGKEPEDGTPKAEYIDDAAFTLLVARSAGVPIVRVSLMLLARGYVAGSNAPMFVTFDVTRAVVARSTELGARAPALVASLLGRGAPSPMLSMTCRDCEYFATSCIGVGIDDSVLRIPRINEKKLAELHPHTRIGALPRDVKLTYTQQRVVDLIRTTSVARDEKALANLQSVRWPVHYLDFEAVMPAIPWFEGDGAYTTTAHQYSVHSREAPGASLSHSEYLASVEGDWRREIAERLIQDLGGEGSIIVYSSYERTRLTALAASFPDLADDFSRFASRLFDLEPFFRNGYVDHRFAGSSSIKKVLPVMVPGVSYEQLAVSNGTDAAGVFSLMRVREIPDDEHDARRRELLEYCALDTMAMVRLHDALMELR
jgi:hypothetical protein